MKRGRSDTPKSPGAPWRRLLVRSRSLERRNQKDDGKGSREEGGAGWSNWLLLTPPTMMRSAQQRRAAEDSSHLSKGGLLHQSNLNMFLLQLHSILKDYCHLLKDPSISNARAAAQLLEHNGGTSPQNKQSSRRSPPSPSLLFRRASTVAREGEWETYTSPLLLLTGVEALYGQEQHLSKLSSLYQTIVAELIIINERLCQPWLGVVSSSQSPEKQAAVSVSATLEQLQVFCSIRIKMVEHPETLRELLSTIPDIKTEALPMLSSLQQELKARIALRETIHSLNQCRFTETILATQRLKQHINFQSETKLQEWFRNVLQRIVAVLPMYFDRIHAFGSPLYGFDALPLSTTKYDAAVLDFLRRQENKGGPSMAISLVLNALETDNLQFGRGVVLVDRYDSHVELTPMERERQEWQAVYMRTTVHHGSTLTTSPLSRSPSHGSGSISSIMRRGRGSFAQRPSITAATLKITTSKRDVAATSEDDFLTSIMRAASHDSSGGSVQAHQVNMNVMEYAPETGPCSWPHTEWHGLVELLQDESAPATTSNSEEDRQTVTYRPPEPAVDEGRTVKRPLSLIALEHALPPSPPPPPPPPTKPASTSSFHVIRLSEYVWMCCIIKNEEDGKWHLRRSRGHSDEEIRAFLNDMSTKLKVSSLLDKPSLQDRVPTEPQHSSPGHDLDRVWQQFDEDHVQGFLRELKKSFRLRPQSPYMESLQDREATNASRKRQMRKRSRAVSHSESALAFFVGTDFVLEKPPHTIR